MLMCQSLGILYRSPRILTRLKPGPHLSNLSCSSTQLSPPHVRWKKCFHQRGYRYLASQQQESQSSTRNPANPQANQAGTSPTDEKERHVSVQEQRRKDWDIIKRLFVHIWPPNDWGVKGRVLLGLGLLVTGKVSFPRILENDT